MGLRILSGPGRAHWRRLANQHTIKVVTSRFIHAGRHIYIEPDMMGTWTVCVDAEHALYLDNMLTKDKVLPAKLLAPEKETVT